MLGKILLALGAIYLVHGHYEGKRIEEEFERQRKYGLVSLEKAAEEEKK